MIENIKNPDKYKDSIKTIDDEISRAGKILSNLNSPTDKLGVTNISKINSLEIPSSRIGKILSNLNSTSTKLGVTNISKFNSLEIPSSRIGKILSNLNSTSAKLGVTNISEIGRINTILTREDVYNSLEKAYNHASKLR